MSVSAENQPSVWSSFAGALTRNMGSVVGGFNTILRENPYIGMLGIGTLAVVGGLFGYWKHTRVVKKLTDQAKEDREAKQQIEDQIKEEKLRYSSQKNIRERRSLALDRQRSSSNRAYVDSFLRLGDRIVDLEKEKQKDKETIHELTRELAQEKEFSERLMQKQLKEVQASDKRLGDLDCNIDEPLNGLCIGNTELIGADLIEEFVIKARNAGIIVDRAQPDSDKPSKEQIYQWIRKGGLYAYHLFFSGDTQQIPTNNQDAYLDSIISLTWYFFAHAIIKGEAFTQGSFMIIDPNNRLQEFLMGYAHSVNTQTLSTPVGSLALPWDSNGYAYKRVSSHLKASVKSGEEFHHYGIDVRFKGEEQSDGTRGWAKPWLPAQKRHILFGKVHVPIGTDSMVFFKIEDYGLFKTDGYPQHAGEFGISLGRKVAPAVFGSDDAKDNRKERIEGAVKKAVQKLVAQEGSPLTPQDQKKVISDVATYGVQCFYRYAQQWSEKSIDNDDREYHKWLNNVRAYMQDLDEMYDHIGVRYGREVILAPQDMFDAAYYLRLSKAESVTDLRKVIDATILGYRIWGLLKTKQDSHYSSINSILGLKGYTSLDAFIAYISGDAKKHCLDKECALVKARIEDLAAKFSDSDIGGEIEKFKEYNNVVDGLLASFDNSLTSSLSSSFLAPTCAQIAHEQWQDETFHVQSVFYSHLSNHIAQEKSLDDKAARDMIQQVLTYRPKGQKSEDDASRIALMLVHGTIPPWASQNKDFFVQGNPVFEAIRSFAQELGDREHALVEVVSLKWGGSNSDASRKTAGGTFARLLDGRYAEYRKIYTIAHSHGGNVVNVATNEMSKACIDTMIHLYTPAVAKDDSSYQCYQPHEDKYNRWFNLYSTGDMVQFAGSFQGWNIFSGGSSRKQSAQNVWNVRMQVDAASPGHTNKVHVMRNLYDLITKIDGDATMHQEAKWRDKVGRYSHYRDLEGHAFSDLDKSIVVAIRHRDEHDNCADDAGCQICAEHSFSDSEEVEFKQSFPGLDIHTKWYTADIVARFGTSTAFYVSSLFGGGSRSSSPENL